LFHHLLAVICLLQLFISISAHVSRFQKNFMKLYEPKHRDKDKGCVDVIASLSLQLQRGRRQSIACNSGSSGDG